jgi:hypothetical protein
VKKYHNTTVFKWTSHKDAFQFEVFLYDTLLCPDQRREEKKPDSSWTPDKNLIVHGLLIKDLIDHGLLIKT